MIRRIGAMAIIAAFVLMTGHTAEADNVTALPSKINRFLKDPGLASGSPTKTQVTPRT